MLCSLTFACHFYVAALFDTQLQEDTTVIWPFYNMFMISEHHIKHFVLEIFLFVLGLTSLLNIWGHITTVSACSSGTLTNVLPHRNAMQQTQDMTPHPVTE